jgi:hypothetical protein
VENVCPVGEHCDVGIAQACRQWIDPILCGIFSTTSLQRTSEPRPFLFAGEIPQVFAFVVFRGDFALPELLRVTAWRISALNAAPSTASPL